MGLQYGKPISSNSRIAIFSAEETNQQTEERLLPRPPIPELGYLKSKIASIELENWVVDQWNKLSGFRLLVSEEEARRNASVILRKLGNNFPSDLNNDFSVSCNISPLIQTVGFSVGSFPPKTRPIAVGINVYSWTVWAFACIVYTALFGAQFDVGDCAGSEYVTVDADEF